MGQGGASVFVHLIDGVANSRAARAAIGKIKSVVPGGKWYLVSGLFDGGDERGADALVASGDVELAPEGGSPGVEKRKRRPGLSSRDKSKDGIRYEIVLVFLFFFPSPTKGQSPQCFAPSLHFPPLFSTRHISLHKRAAQIRLERYRLDKARLESDASSRQAYAGMQRLAGEIDRTRRMLEDWARRTPGASVRPAGPAV